MVLSYKIWTLERILLASCRVFKLVPKGDVEGKDHLTGGTEEDSSLSRKLVYK